MEQGSRRRKLPTEKENGDSPSPSVKRQKIANLLEEEDGEDVPQSEEEDEYTEGSEKARYQSHGENDEEEEAAEFVEELEKERDTEAEAGILEKIRLENFMCHKHLELSFGPNINFIVGVNGSGKSAILVALTICLGAKATFTNRGKKLTEFIRGNANYASISVTLKNCGTEAYRYEDYGPAIIIERRLLRSGASTYKVKNHNGKRTIATSRKEVAMIMEQFNIQIDNPCVILMQDTSRQFLNTSRPQDKYTFFLKATQLEQMKEDYDQIVRKLDDMKITLSRKATVLPEMQKKVEELERLYNTLENLRSLQAKVIKFKEMLAWSIVVDKEQEVEEARVAVEQFGEKVAQYDAAIEKFKAMLVGLAEENKQKVEELDQIGSVLKRVNEELAQAKQEISGINSELNRSKSKMKDVQARISNTRKREENVRKYIEDTQQKAAMDTRHETEERMRKIEELTTSIEEYQAAAAKLTQEKEEKDSEIARVREQGQDVERKEAELKSEVGKLQQVIQNLKLQKQDGTRLFGPKVPEVLAAIEQERRWRQKPIGPIGLVMRLKDPKWGTAIDTAIGKTLTLFAVDNINDMQLLKQIGKRVGSELDIVVQEFTDQVYRLTEEDLPPPHLISILSQIEAAHPMVKNILIDQAAVETKILVEDLREAQDIIYRQRPRNARQAFLPDGSRVFMSGRSEVFNAGKGASRKLGVNFDEQIRETTRHLQDRGEKLKHIQPERQAVAAELKRLTDENRTIQREIVKLQRQMGQLQGEVSELQNVQEPKDLDVADLEANLELLLNEQNQLEEQLMVAEKEVAGLELRKRPLVEVIEEKTKESHSLTKRNEKMVGELGRINGKVHKVTVNQDKVAAQKRHLLNDKDKEQRDYDKLVQELAELTEKATRFCPTRVQPEASTDKLSQEIERLQRRIEEEQRGKKSPAEITSDYRNALKTYKETKAALDRLVKFRSKLEKNLRERMRRWLRFRKSIALRTKVYFNSYLTRKNYSGQLIFYHKDHRLEIEIQTDNASQQQEIRNTKSLSGGERSFSTVALLLALWEAMECPFRAMDEFDVFMDAVNRHISITLLIESARANPNRQFIFITPHDMSPIAKGPDIRIHKMHPPDRGQSQLEQGILPFGNDN